jgi:hypothetical protein
VKGTQLGAAETEAIGVAGARTAQAAEAQAAQRAAAALERWNQIQRTQQQQVSELSRALSAQQEGPPLAPTRETVATYRELAQAQAQAAKGELRVIKESQVRRCDELLKQFDAEPFPRLKAPTSGTPGKEMLQQAEAFLKDIPPQKRIEAFEHYRKVIERETAKAGGWKAIPKDLPDGGRVFLPTNPRVPARVFGPEGDVFKVPFKDAEALVQSGKIPNYKNPPSTWTRIY